ncbi:MAG: HDOD domain-containing protein [Pseudomonadales bacterium]|nr:HDOD domain-containing protein [Pseudomonadales bacterium]
MDSVSVAVLDEVTTLISNDELDLPTLPEVALNIRAAAEQDDISVAELAKVIGEDPGLAAKVVSVANSPLYRGVRETETISMAVSRLGVPYSSNLATALAMQHMFQATSEIIDTKLREVWKHATEVAGISSVFCKIYTKLQPDQAMLAGLTHSIGVLPILAWAEENNDMLNDSILLDKVIEQIHGTLGVMILKNWGFPEDLVLVPELYDMFERDSACVDYADIVMIANLQIERGSDHPYANLDYSLIPAFRKLGLDPDVESGSMDDISEDIESAKELLK